ncbi:TPA: hypothetical protein DHW58_00020 [Patescibacteria group bacterium]|nr:hypothetical protein [Patescibacteria group bacterium]
MSELGDTHEHRAGREQGNAQNEHLTMHRRLVAQLPSDIPHPLPMSGYLEWLRSKPVLMSHFIFDFSWLIS